MSLPATGPLYLGDIQSEFGGSNPIYLDEYLRGGLNVPLGGSPNINIPTSGQTEMDLYRGASKTVIVTYELIGGGGGGGYGKDDNSGTGSAGSGTDTLLSGGGITLLTANGGLGGRNGVIYRYDPHGGEASFYGPGGLGGALKTAGSPAPISSYGAGGGAGGGDTGGLFDADGDAGEGGFAGTRLTGTFEVVYDSVMTATIGLAGIGTQAGDFWGADGAPGYVKLSWGGNNSQALTADGTITIN